MKSRSRSTQTGRATRQRNRGDESFCSALLRGHPLFRLDNLRGRLEPLSRSLRHRQDRNFSARGFKESGLIQSGRYILQASSNGIQGTRISRIEPVSSASANDQTSLLLKDTKGKVVEHGRAHQGKFLGAIHTVVEEWVKKGKQENGERPHDFKEWAGILDWIMTNIFKRPGPPKASAGRTKVAATKAQILPMLLRNRRYIRL